MTEMTLGPDDLRRLADLLWGPTRYEITTARKGMRACASVWEADLARIEALKGERDDAVALIRAAGGTWAGPDAALAGEEK